MTAPSTELFTAGISDVQERVRILKSVLRVVRDRREFQEGPEFDSQDDYERFAYLIGTRAIMEILEREVDGLASERGFTLNPDGTLAEKLMVILERTSEAEGQHRQGR